ncbi:MAG: zinc ABC transporter substrate-binding protein, partial [Acidobacteria bacterium]|nr:zinc ABC transporter substrate-binding protein [Acidobacteriota bacterium]
MPQIDRPARRPVAAACAAAVWALALLAAGGPALAAAAAPAARPGGASRIAVFVSIPPQAMLVERVGGARARVDILVPPGQSPHTFEPTPKQMARLAGARVFFAIGLPFEKRLLEKAAAANPSLKVVDMRAGVPLRRMTAGEGEPPGHDEGHTHGAAEPPGHDNA